MTPDEFRSARKALRLSEEEMAETLKLTSHDVVEIENGRKRIPRATARELALRHADARRDAIMAASGLAECPVALEFVRRLEGLRGEEGLKVLETFAAHAAECPICKAREKYAAQHLASIPQILPPLSFRVLDWIVSASDRLPAPLRPPDGPSGEARRMAVAAGFYVYPVGIAYATLVAIVLLVRNGSASNWWQSPLLGAAIIPFAWVLGAFLAATVFDLTRPIAHQFWGCVIRGGLMLPAFYGSVALAFGLVQTRTVTFGTWPAIVIGVSAIGALGGGLLWVVHWVRGKLPSSVA